MPANTLVKMATQAAARVVASINDFADLPYALARPILLKVDNPQQLRDIEVNCPHIAEESEELWRRLIARDIPDWQQKIVEPKNKNSWHKVYRYLHRNEEKQAAADEEALRKAMQGEGLKKAQSQTLVVKKALPHPRAEDEPNKFIDGVARKDLNDWGQKKQPSLKNAKNGKDALAAIRRQTAFAASQKSRAAPLRPQSQAQQLASAKRQITQAPQSMIREITKAPNQLTIAPRELLPHEKEQLAEVNRQRIYNRRIIGPKAPGRLSDLEHAQRHRATVEAARAKALADNEAKLRAITQQQKKEPPAKSKDFEFAPSPVVVDPAKRSLSPPQNKTTDKASSGTSAASPPPRPASQLFNGCRVSAVEIHTTLTPEEKAAIVEKHQKNGDQVIVNNRKTEQEAAAKPVDQNKPAASPETVSPPPQQVSRKRPATNIFMTPKRRRV